MLPMSMDPLSTKALLDLDCTTDRVVFVGSGKDGIHNCLVYLQQLPHYQMYPPLE
jgi:hypothetical protein